MPPKRTTKHYPTNEVLKQDAFLTIMDVYEHHWLLEHTHDFPEIICVLGGNGTQYINGTAVTAKAGDIYLIPVGTTHVFRPAAKADSAASLLVRNVIFRAEWLDDLTRIVMDEEVKELIFWMLGKPGSAEQGRPPWLKIADTQAEFRLLSERMKSLVQQKPPLFRTRLTSRVTDLLALLCIAAGRGIGQHSDWPPKEEAHPVKAQILAAIQAMPLAVVTLKEVARKLDRSERHLSRMFQHHFGTSFKSYMQDCRLQKSMQLLAESKLTVKEIRSEIGLEDANHFYCMFKRETGMTPGQYRNREQGSSASEGR
ncbi:helix-turn-helix domain-containing protein [Paenibacillus spongiae]|uniref:AraC family transcriptional regulator n=1 Tax=Paenibacillus spongiae TaxID=2909671 RepID=A0ABY5S899_9BACL|nr:AraC family transcriptional regulator [Paenibacillus spongiae]UVI29753.1 AraC family transcriptional regulator [Paenibacillus spongiae]